MGLYELKLSFDALGVSSPILPMERSLLMEDSTDSLAAGFLHFTMICRGICRSGKAGAEELTFCLSLELLLPPSPGS